MSSLMQQPKWLDGYASGHHDWHQISRNGSTAFYRRLGIVEGLFDTDGTDFVGRADLNMNLNLELRTSLDQRRLRERIRKVWSVVRQRHILLSSRAVQAVDLSPHIHCIAADERIFAFEPASSLETLSESGAEHVVFVGDKYPQTDAAEFYPHLLNSSRSIDASRALSKLLVMPIKHTPFGTISLHLILVAAHQIADGLTIFRWMSSFIDHFNMSDEKLTTAAKKLCTYGHIDRLPPAQESLYPPIIGSRARRRWFWLLTRILRHTRRPPSASFQNPLRRAQVLEKASPMLPEYAEILNYHQTPPLNSFAISATLSKRSTHRLAHLCQQAKISIGSGCFTLVGIVMMQFEEIGNPDVPFNERLPFVGSFPVNPRPFLSGPPTTGKEDSLMLAFSEGITLPFLPNDLGFEARFRLLGRQAHRQLRQYQKRKRTAHEEAILGSRSSSQLLPSLYVSTMERLEDRRRPEQRRGWDIQGSYPAKMSSTLATCGVSSVGDRTNLIASGKYDVSKLQDGHDLVADFRDSQNAVRARDGEFLVGAAGDKDSLAFSVSYDGCFIDPAKAQQWKQVIEHILETPGRDQKL